MKSACRLCFATFALILLAACASSSIQSTAPGSPPLVLQQISTTATGDFVTSLDQARSTVLLTVVAEPLLSAEQPLALNLTQQAENSSPRRFRLLINANEADTRGESRLSGTLAPISANGRAIAECPLAITISAQGLSASTQADSCQFGQAGEQIGLIKELLFTGDQVRVADRLIDLTSARLGNGSQPKAISDTSIQFFRLSRYQGWGGVLEGDEWRIARELEIDTADGRIEPVDAAGMSLGFVIELDRSVLEGQDISVVRLTVRDVETNQTIARSWAQSNTRQLGIALPALQIGLERMAD